MENFGGLAESEYVSQAHVFICFYLIQLCFVYLNVYQLLDLIPRNGSARITSAQPKNRNKMILTESVHTIHFCFYFIKFIILSGVWLKVRCILLCTQRYHILNVHQKLLSQFKTRM